MLALAASTPGAYWYLTRGTGTVATILLTLSVALGVANVRRICTRRVPRFVLLAIHRNASLLAVAFLIVHVATSLLDADVPIRLLDVVVPFATGYRTLWLGLGAVGLDLLVAIVITSLFRRRFGYRAWRRIHWASYAAWPFALAHGLGMGSDTATGWMVGIVTGCVVVVVLALAARLALGDGHRQRRRGPRDVALVRPGARDHDVAPRPGNA